MIRICPEGRVVGINLAMKDLLGDEEAEALRGAPFPEGLFLDSGSRVLLRELLAKNLRVRGMMGQFRDPDGHLHWVRVDALRIHGNDGRHECDELYVSSMRVKSIPRGSEASTPSIPTSRG